MPEIPFKHNRILHVMISLFVVIWGILAFYPVDRKDWLLENALMLLFIGAIAFLYRTFKFSNLSYLFMILFLTLHAIGAHYAYQHTPIDIWVKQYLHTSRGVYDRIVHLAFGLLFAYPIKEVLVRVVRIQGGWLYAIIFAIIMGFSAVFEIAEVMATLLVNPQLAEEYLGLQGDQMDSQKDMAMSLIGVVVAITFMLVFRYFRRREGKS